MKNLQLLTVIPLALVLLGCANTGQEAIAYRTLGAIGQAVDSAMVIYADAVVAGAIDEDHQTQVRALHERYRVAYATSVAAARMDVSQLPPEDLAAMAAELTILILNLTDS